MYFSSPTLITWLKMGSQAISYSFPGYYETPTSCGKAMSGKNNNKYGRQAEVGVWCSERRLWQDLASRFMACLCSPAIRMERGAQGHLLQGLVNIQLDLSDWCNDWVKRLMKREVSSRKYQESTRVQVSLPHRLTQVLKHFRLDKNLIHDLCVLYHDLENY